MPALKVYSWAPVLAFLLSLLSGVARAEPSTSASNDAVGSESQAEPEPEAESTPDLERSTSAEADVIRECVEQHDSGHRLKLEGEWRAARSALARCAVDTCPVAVRSSCQSWLQEIQRDMPSVVVVVEGAADAGDRARISLAGREAESELWRAEIPIQLDPGEHTLRIELAPFAPATRQISLKRGDQQVLRVRFGESQPPATTPPREPGRLLVTERPVQPLTYGLAAGAVASFAAGAALYIAAFTELDAARDTCRPDCDPEVRARIDRHLLLGDIAAGAGLLFGAVAVYTYWSRPVRRRVMRAGDTGWMPQGLAVSGSSEGMKLWYVGAF